MPDKRGAVPEDQQCGKYVNWWEGEYEGECELPSGHAGPHFDGMSWYDDEGEEVDSPTTEETS